MSVLERRSAFRTFEVVPAFRTYGSDSGDEGFDVPQHLTAVVAEQFRWCFVRGSGALCLLCSTRARHILARVQ